MSGTALQLPVAAPLRWGVRAHAASAGYPQQSSILRATSFYIPRVRDEGTLPLVQHGSRTVQQQNYLWDPATPGATRTGLSCRKAVERYSAQLSEILTERADAQVRNPPLFNNLD